MIINPAINTTAVTAVKLRYLANLYRNYLKKVTVYCK